MLMLQQGQVREHQVLSKVTKLVTELKSKVAPELDVYLNK